MISFHPAIKSGCVADASSGCFGCHSYKSHILILHLMLLMVDVLFASHVYYFEVIRLQP